MARTRQRRRRVTGNPDFFAPHASVIHVDVDPAEIGKVRQAEIPIVGDVGRVLEQMLEAWGDRPSPDHTEWLDKVTRWKTDHPVTYDQQPDGPLKPQYVIEQLHRQTGGDAIVVSGVGQHQMWTALHWKFSKPREWINSGGLGTMGFGVPAAIGAKAGAPDRTVFLIDGDGSFQMTHQELATASEEGLPIKIALLNNGVHGMVRQWQTLFYGKRYSASELGRESVNFPMLAEAMGCVGIRVERPEEVVPAIEKSLSINDRPVLIEFVVDPDEMVFPMVPAGGSNDQIILGPEDLA
jgi:acetolactate synthase-1/2/3 large subunit